MNTILIVVTFILISILIIASIINYLALRKAAKASIPRVDHYFAETR